MRKLIVTNIASVDGFYSGPNDDVKAMPFDTKFSDYPSGACERPIRSSSAAAPSSSTFAYANVRSANEVKQPHAWNLRTMVRSNRR